MERISSLIVGAQRQGKTYYCEKQLIQYAKSGGTSVVYNIGRIGDFKDFLEVKILTVDNWIEGYQEKHRKKPNIYDIPKELDFFIFRGKTYHLKDFAKMFKGKCVKIERVFSTRFRNEGFFINSIYKYFYNCLLVFDDCRVIFRNGLSSEMCGLLSRLNHCGKNYCDGVKNVGIDVALVYHSFKAVNDESYSYINHIVQFVTMFEPKLPIVAEEIEPEIIKHYDKLKIAEKYSRIEYSLFTGNSTFFKP